MRSTHVLRTVTGILGAATMLWSQAVQTTAIRAGKLFEPKSGQMLANCPARGRPRIGPLQRGSREDIHHRAVLLQAEWGDGEPGASQSGGTQGRRR